MIKGFFRILVFGAGFALIAVAPAVSFAGMNSSSGRSDLMTVATIGVNGFVMVKTCPKCSTDAMSCAMCAMTGWQIIETLTTNEGSQSAERNTACTGSHCYGGGPTTTLYNGGGPDGGTGPTTTLYNGGGDPNDPNDDIGRLFGAAGINPDDLKARAAANVKAMEAKGYKVNKDGSVTTPHGTFAGSALSSEGGMKAAGFSDKDIKARNALLEQAKAEGQRLEDQLSKLVGDDDGVGGGGFAGSDGGSGRKDYNPFNLNAFLQKPKTEIPKPAVSGLSKAHGSDRIGVASDNLFQMAARCYQDQRKSGGFLETPAASGGSSGNGD